jgi:hypothetical protein
MKVYLFLTTLCFLFVAKSTESSAQQIEGFVIVEPLDTNKSWLKKRFLPTDGKPLKLDNVVGTKLIRNEETIDRMVNVYPYNTRDEESLPFHQPYWIDSWKGDFSVTVVSDTIWKVKQGWLLLKVRKDS